MMMSYKYNCGTMARTTVTMSKEFRQELEDLKINDESMEEMLKRVIKGSKKDITQHNEPLAFTLEQYDDITENTELIQVFWSQLFTSNEGDIYDFDYKSSNCVNESAKILIRDKDYILVEFITEGFENHKKVFKDHNFVCFNLFH